MNTLERFSLDGKVAVVTGGTRGLGEGFVEALAGAGATVAIVGRDDELGKKVKESVEGFGGRAEYFRADIMDRSAVESLREQVLAAFGRIDILVNNAGACIHAPALEVTPEDWQHVIDLNVTALWNCSQIFGQVFVDQRDGVIINVGSMSGFIVNRPQWQPAYNASKAAVHHLTRSLAAEWAVHGVRVNALAPGYIKTEMSPVDDLAFRQHWIEDAPMKRYGTVEELAPTVVFLASEASSFVTGSILVADGGYTVF